VDQTPTRKTKNEAEDVVEVTPKKAQPPRPKKKAMPARGRPGLLKRRKKGRPENATPQKGDQHLAAVKAGRRQRSSRTCCPL